MSSSRVFKMVTILAGVGLGLVVVAELVARYVMPTDPSGEVSVTFQNQVDEFHGSAKISFTGEGLRPAIWRQLKAEKRVLCLGNDNTFHPLQGDEHEWWAKLGENLNQRQAGVRTVGMGIPGGTLTDLAAWTEAFIDLDQFDAVVVYAGINEVRARNGASDISADAQGDAYFGFRYKGFKSFLMKNFGLVRNYVNSKNNLQTQVNNSFYGRLSELNAVVDLLAAQRDHAGAVRRASMAQTGSAYLPFFMMEGLGGVEEAERALVEQSLQAIRRIALQCEQAGVPLCVVFEPTLENKRPFSEKHLAKMRSVQVLSEDRVGVLDPLWVAEIYTKIAAAMQLEAGQSGFSFVDLQSVEGQKLEYHYDEVLLTDMGAEFVAETLELPVFEILKKKM